MSANPDTLPAQISIPFGVFYFFYFVLIGVYIIYLPQMLKSHGYTATEVGVIYAAAPMMRFILPFVFRRYISLDERLYVVSSIAMVGATLVSAMTVDHFWLYLAASLFLGGSMGVILPYIDTIALQVISKERYGRVRLWGSVGFVIIAIVLGEYLDTLYQAFVYLNLSALLTAASGVYLLRFDPHRVEETSGRDNDRDFSLLRYWAFWASAFLLQVSFGGFYNFFTIYESDHHISQSMISYLWSFGVLMEIVMLYFQGPLLRDNLMILIKLTTLSAVIRWVMLWIWPDSLMVSYLSQALHATSFALYYTATISYVYRLYTQKKLAQQFYLGITFGLGGSLGALLAGAIYDFKSEYLFGAEAIIAAGALMMIYLHEHRKESKYVGA